MKNSYKIIASGYSLEISIKKHADVGVLIAVVDSAFFTATYSEEVRGISGVLDLLFTNEKHKIFLIGGISGVLKIL